MTSHRPPARRAAIAIAIAALAGVLLTGCALGPAYHRPASDIPIAFRASPASAAAAWPSPSWWRGFGSPELDGLIDDARRASFDILAAIARVREADQQIRIAGAPLLPSVSLSAQAQYAKQGLGTHRGTGSLTGAPTAIVTGGGSHYTDTRFYEVLPSVSYELDFWGRLRAQQQSAVASDLFSRYDQQTVALTAVTSVATTYFAALADEDRLAVAQRNLRDATEILTAIRARESAGTASLLDVSQQEALVAGIRAEIPGLRSGAEQEIIALAILVGRPPERVVVPPGTLDTLSLPEIAPGLPSELLQRRPDVASAEAELIAANANIRAARAAFFPQITLTGSAGWESSALSSLINPGSALFQIAASAAQTVFDNGLAGGTFQQARARYDELLADYQKAVVQAFSDVETALVAYRYATEQESLEREAVRTAQLAADIARAQVEAGTSDIVTALQAQTTLFSDLDTLAQDRLSRFNALVSLYKALGGGWSRGDTPPPDDSIYHGVL